MATLRPRDRLLGRCVIRGGRCVDVHDPAIPGTVNHSGEADADGVKMQVFGTVFPDVGGR